MVKWTAYKLAWFYVMLLAILLFLALIMDFKIVRAFVNMFKWPIFILGWLAFFKLLGGNGK